MREIYSVSDPFSLPGWRMGQNRVSAYQGDPPTQAAFISVLRDFTGNSPPKKKKKKKKNSAAQRLVVRWHRLSFRGTSTTAPTIILLLCEVAGANGAHHRQRTSPVITVAGFTVALLRRESIFIVLVGPLTPQPLSDA